MPTVSGVQTGEQVDPVSASCHLSAVSAADAFGLPARNCQTADFSWGACLCLPGQGLLRVPASASCC